MKNIQPYIPDEIDKKLVNTLLLNSKTTHREMATIIGIAVGTVNTRIKRLEREKIIQHYSIFVDYEKMGYSIEVIITLKIKEGKFHELSKELIADPNIYVIYDTTGEFDAEVLARFHNKRQLDSFIKRLQQHNSIVSTSTRLLLNIMRGKEVN
ncbi:MAG: Lrp/AsnC family transcriptional regulator [Candidatus Woesearchaeota archaeon]